MSVAGHVVKGKVETLGIQQYAVRSRAQRPPISP